MKILISAILFTLFTGMFILTTPKIDRKVVYKEVCDTTQMMTHYQDCIKNILDGSESEEMRKYYKEECKKESKRIYCKKVRGIRYSKHGEFVKFIPCDSVNKSIDIQMCNK